jgi:4,5-dihydroxyphthalate decarboxylase
MAATLHLTLACGDYEIVRALKQGEVKADGIELTLLTDMDSTARHWRMIRDREFDVCELSLSSYLMAGARGQDLSAIPVFLHRRFRHGFIFINTDTGIRQPADLIGRKVGTGSFQATANVWMRGILEHEYGVPHQKLHWIVTQEEAVPFAASSSLALTRAPPGRPLSSMLVQGELDAVLHTDVIAAIRDHDPRVGRLFENYKELEIAYYKKTGIFPIMHTTAIKQAIVERHPWVPASLMRAFEQAKEVAYRRMENPRVVPLAWFQTAFEEQQAVLGPDPWAYGLDEANRRNLQTLIQYSHDQGLIDRVVPVDALFVQARSD